jgi:hypothetical protein
MARHGAKGQGADADNVGAPAQHGFFVARATHQSDADFCKWDFPEAKTAAKIAGFGQQQNATECV